MVWSSILVVALLFALNPGVLGVIVLLISRPRPVHNLLAFWLGSVVVSVPLLLVPLMLLQLAPDYLPFAHDLATPSSPAARHVQISMGLVTLLIASVLSVRHLNRRSSGSTDVGPRQRSVGRHRMPRGPVSVQSSAGSASTVVLDPTTPAETLAPLNRFQNAATEGGSVVRRLIRRGYRSWENGAVWIAFVFGMTLFPGPPLVLFVVTTIVSAGESIGTQVVAGTTFVIVMLALVEVILVSHVVAPARTQAMLRPLHVWARAHRSLVVIGILAVIGIWQVVRGAGIA